MESASKSAGSAFPASGGAAAGSSGVVEALQPVLGKKTCTVQVDGDSFEVATSVVETLALKLGDTLTASQLKTLQTAADTLLDAATLFHQAVTSPNFQLADASR